MSGTLGNASQIAKTSKIDPKFKQELSRSAGAEKIALCFQCGTCTADCPVARFNSFYKPRKIARMAQLGFRDRLLSDEALWLCTTCYTCVDHCPQGVEVSSIVRALRNMSVKERGMMPAVYKTLFSNILKTGLVYLIPESKHKKRQEQGLPPLPKSNVEHILKIFQTTGCLETLENAKVFEKAKNEVSN